jgi:hypothetical protein
VTRQRRWDRFHSETVDRACELDREYAERHPEATSYVRPALLHELCLPGQPCRPVDFVHVLLLAPGIRGRLAL